MTVRSGEVTGCWAATAPKDNHVEVDRRPLLEPFHAAVTYDGKPWRTDRPWRSAGVGISYIPAERFAFAGLTVDENLALGAYTAPAEAFEPRLAQVREMFPILKRRGNDKAGTMSGGEQRCSAWPSH